MQFEVFMQELLDVLVANAIHLFELVGVIVLIVAGVQGVINYIRHDPMVRLKLAKGMALCLEFKLGSEIFAYRGGARLERDRHRGRDHCAAGGADLPAALGNQERGGRGRKPP